jgi:transcriptional regulator with XRE-family HTH domain
MTIGEKIRIIRKFRNISLEELGVSIGFEEKSAANRMTQYETNYRVPKKDSLIQIAKVLNVNPLNFFVEITGTAEDIIQTLFWLDESSPDAVNLFRLSRDSGMSVDSDEGEARYIESDSWPAEPPIGLWFRYGTVDILLREWAIRKEELNRGEITRDEYFEWKLNWPHTCDDEGRHEPRIKWRAER